MKKSYREKGTLDLAHEYGYSAVRNLAATSLERDHGIKVVGTNNLHEHLLLDTTTKTLFIFHHISFLREYLIATRISEPHVP
jgi:hypothetical protein